MRTERPHLCADRPPWWHLRNRTERRIFLDRPRARPNTERDIGSGVTRIQIPAGYVLEVAGRSDHTMTRRLPRTAGSARPGVARCSTRLTGSAKGGRRLGALRIVSASSRQGSARRPLLVVPEPGVLTRCRLSNFWAGAVTIAALRSSCLRAPTVEEAMGPSSSRDARVHAAWKGDRGYLFAIAAGMLGRLPRPRTWCRRRSPGWRELPSRISTMSGDGWWWLPAGCAWTGSARPTPAGR